MMVEDIAGVTVAEVIKKVPNIFAYIAVGSFLLAVVISETSIPTKLVGVAFVFGLVFLTMWFSKKLSEI